MTLLFISCGDNTFLPSTQLTKAEVYFPLHVGDQWQYAWDINETNKDNYTVSVVGTTIFNNTKYFTLKGEFAVKKLDLPLWYMRVEDSRVYLYSNGKEYFDIDFDRMEVDTINKLTSYVAVSNKTIDITPGKFEGCVETAAYLSSIDAVPYRSFAPNVGMVSSVGEVLSLVLTYARINGKEYGRK
ncbi:MAG: hypothetical protein IPM69_12710 [Ignavibacteria bacterium]|nr:hypothetical protein [Ignavibacteria bacterium]